MPSAKYYYNGRTKRLVLSQYGSNKDTGWLYTEKAAKHGLRLRRHSWPAGEYIKWSQNKRDFVFKNGDEFGLSKELDLKDWVFVDQPPQGVFNMEQLVPYGDLPRY